MASLDVSSPFAFGSRPTVATRLARLASPAYKLLLVLSATLIFGLTVWQGLLGAAWVNQPFNGFFVQPMLYVSPYQHAPWHVETTGLLPLDSIRAVDGVPVRDTAALVAAARAVPVGHVLTYEVIRGGQPLRVRVPTRTFTFTDFVETFGFYVLLGASFMGGALMLLWVRPRLAAARAFALLAFSLGLVMLFYFDFQATSRLTALAITGYALAGVGFMATALYFPRRSRLLDRFKWLPQALAALGVVAVSALQLGMLREGVAFAAPGRYQAGMGVIFAINFLMTFGMVWMLVSILLGFFSEPRHSLARRRAGLALTGAAVGLAPLIAWMGPMAFGLNSPVPLNAALYCLGLFPLGIAYAIVRAQLFDIAVVVRNSLLYGLLSAILLGVYMLVAAGFRVLLPTHDLFEELGATMVVVALVVPLRDRLQALIASKLFRAKYDAQQALEAASRSMTGLLDPGSIVAQLEQTLADTLQAGFEAVYLREEDTFVSLGGADAPGLAAESPLVVALAHAGGVLLPDTERFDARFDAFPTVAAAVPLLFQERLQGVLLLGPKRSEVPYTHQDLSLVMTLANQGAIALANAAAYARLQRFNHDLEQRVAERTAALEAAQTQLIQSTKMNALGQLVAGVAHELNNPVTFLAGGVALLGEQLAAFKALCQAQEAGATPEEMQALRLSLGATDLGDELESLFAACQEGAERTQSIVRALRQFSQLESSDVAPVALKACLESTVPRVAAGFPRRIRLHMSLDDVPTVAGSAPQLTQMVTHLLENASQAIASDGDVWLSLRQVEAGVELTVRDSGSGMPPDVRNRIFEPFFTTRTQGTGVGLGLSICLGIVNAHQGRLDVESTPGAGSLFRVVLPRPPEPQESPCALS